MSDEDEQTRRSRDDCAMQNEKGVELNKNLQETEANYTKSAIWTENTRLEYVRTDNPRV